MVGAVTQLPELRVAGGPGAAAAQPHGEVHAGRHRRRARHGRLRRRQHQVCNLYDTDTCIAQIICPVTGVTVTQGERRHTRTRSDIARGVQLRSASGLR